MTQNSTRNLDLVGELTRSAAESAGTPSQLYPLPPSIPLTQPTLYPSTVPFRLELSFPGKKKKRGRRQIADRGTRSKTSVVCVRRQGESVNSTHTDVESLRLLEQSRAVFFTFHPGPRTGRMELTGFQLNLTAKIATQTDSIWGRRRVWHSGKVLPAGDTYLDDTSMAVLGNYDRLRLTRRRLTSDARKFVATGEHLPPNPETPSSVLGEREFTLELLNLSTRQVRTITYHRYLFAYSTNFPPLRKRSQSGQTGT
ncbi:hypothetical protein BaRGS_00035391 [Batillaria attramentaria]|uniref:Uncharacterized protein n=1 Tax=Batillaria attramentaria TaxID=370345 RepID=A0ABD0JEW3_9CAEN